MTPRAAPPGLRRSLRRVLLAMMGVVLLVGTGAATAARLRRPDPAPDAVLAARAAVLRERLRLVRSDTPQLVLDPLAGTLTLARGGVALREWPVAGVAAGRRRLGFGRGSDLPDWRTRPWGGARLDPPVHRERRVIVSDEVTPPDPSGAVDWIPPVPEDAVPTPRRFLVHYPAGLGVEVVAVGGPGGLGLRGLLRRAGFAARELLPRRWDRYRIRILMPAAEAGALYRSFPESAVFLAVLPGRDPPRRNTASSAPASPDPREDRVRSRRAPEPRR